MKNLKNRRNMVFDVEFDIHGNKIERPKVAVAAGSSIEEGGLPSRRGGGSDEQERGSTDDAVDMELDTDSETRAAQQELARRSLEEEEKERAEKEAEAEQEREAAEATEEHEKELEAEQGGAQEEPEQESEKGGGAASLNEAFAGDSLGDRLSEIAKKIAGAGIGKVEEVDKDKSVSAGSAVKGMKKPDQEIEGPEGEEGGKDGGGAGR